MSIITYQQHWTLLEISNLSFHWEMGELTSPAWMFSGFLLVSAWQGEGEDTWRSPTLQLWLPETLNYTLNSAEHTKPVICMNLISRYDVTLSHIVVIFSKCQATGSKKLRREKNEFQLHSLRMCCSLLHALCLLPLYQGLHWVKKMLSQVFFTLWLI